MSEQKVSLQMPTTVGDFIFRLNLSFKLKPNLNAKIRFKLMLRLT